MYLSWSGSTRRFLAAKSKVIVFQGLDRYEKWSEKKENKRKGMGMKNTSMDDPLLYQIHHSFSCRHCHLHPRSYIKIFMFPQK